MPKRDDEPSTDEDFQEIFESVKAYLMTYKIDQHVNEVVNETLKIRPEDPFLHMSNLFKRVSSAQSGVRSVTAREIFSSLGKPTVEVTVTTENGSFCSSVPTIAKADALPGAFCRTDEEAEWFHGEGVKHRASAANLETFPALVGKRPGDQQALDELLLQMDPEEKHLVLGANFLLAASQALCLAGASDLCLSPLDHLLSLSETEGAVLPTPCVTVMARHPNAPQSMFIESIRMYLAVPASLGDQICILSEAQEKMVQTLSEKFPDAAYSRSPSGALWIPPAIDTNETAMEILQNSLQGFPREADLKFQVKFSVDSFFQRSESPEKPHVYTIPVPGKKAPPPPKKKEPDAATGNPMVVYATTFATAFPKVTHLENPLGWDDLEGYATLSVALEGGVMVLGGNYTSGSIVRLEASIERKCFSATVLTPIHVGTVWECLLYSKLAHSQSMSVQMDATLNSTSDTFVVFLALAAQCRWIALPGLRSVIGSALLNEMLRLEEGLNKS